MKTQLLFPHSFKKLGWILLLPAAALGILQLFDVLDTSFMEFNIFAIHSDEFMGDSGWFMVIKNDLSDELAGVFFIIGGIIVAFSKEKNEDEYIAKIRLDSLLWATYLNYVLLVLAFIFIYGISFYMVMMFNMFTILVFFIVRFNLMLYRAKRLLTNEK
ncbi:MAG: hypothetical protein IIA45_00075 [Bacteroidetes bacterium]|nr:hypothetical protein [Bacteroidota bacterium]